MARFPETLKSWDEMMAVDAFQDKRAAYLPELSLLALASVRSVAGFSFGML